MHRKHFHQSKKLKYMREHTREKSHTNVTCVKGMFTSWWPVMAYKVSTWRAETTHLPLLWGKHCWWGVFEGLGTWKNTYWRETIQMWCLWDDIRHHQINTWRSETTRLQLLWEKVCSRGKFEETWDNTYRRKAIGTCENTYRRETIQMWCVH